MRRKKALMALCAWRLLAACGTSDLRNLAGWTTDMGLNGRTQVDWTITVEDQDQPFDAPAVATSGVACTLIGKQTIMRQLSGGAL
jgi:hypothetical protein